MNKIITFLVCFSFFFSIFNPLRAVIHGGDALTMLVPSLIIFVVLNMYLRIRTYLFIFVALIIALLGQNGVAYFENWIPKVIALAFGYFGLEYYLLTEDEFYAKWVLRTTYLTLLLMVAISLPQFIAMPNLTRMMNEASKDPTLEFEYYWAISYKTAHIIPTMSIPLFASFISEKNKWKKSMYGIGIGLLSAIMVFADATTPLIIMVAILSFYWFYNSHHTLNRNILKFLSVALVTLLFISTNPIVLFLSTVQPIFKGSSTYNKIDEMVYYSESGQTSGDMEGREERYQVSLNSIIDNPFLPEPDINNVGKHSHILDYIAAMGIILFIPYALLLYERYKRPLSYLNELRPHFNLAFLSFLILAISKNYFIFATACFLVPMYLIRLETKIEETEYDDEDFCQESEELSQIYD